MRKRFEDTSRLLLKSTLGVGRNEISIVFISFSPLHPISWDEFHLPSVSWSGIRESRPTSESTTLKGTFPEHDRTILFHRIDFDGREAGDKELEKVGREEEK